MATTILSTVYPTDVFNSQVVGAPAITRAGTAVDNSLVAAVLASAVGDNVTLLVGGVGGAVSVVTPGLYFNAGIGAPTIGAFAAGSICTDSTGAGFTCPTPGSPGGWQPLAPSSALGVAATVSA
jgi:hypothetical protein